MMGHKICFYEEIWIIIPELSLITLLIWSTDKLCIRFSGGLCFPPLFWHNMLTVKIQQSVACQF